jgi:SSS family solute:Na+ symporter
MTGVAFTVGALSNVAFYNATGQIAIKAAGANDSIYPHLRKGLPARLVRRSLPCRADGRRGFHAERPDPYLGTALGRDFFKESLKLKAGTVTLTRLPCLSGFIISIALAYLSSKLDVSLAIIAVSTSLFYGLCAATFLPSYFAALYVKSFTKGAALASMLTGSIVSLLWLFFVQEKTASSLHMPPAVQRYLSRQGHFSFFRSRWSTL